MAVWLQGGVGLGWKIETDPGAAKLETISSLLPVHLNGALSPADKPEWGTSIATGVFVLFRVGSLFQTHQG